MTELDEPLEVFGEEVSEVVGTVTWEGGRIAPEEFEEFAFTARTPEEEAVLEFPALQTYSGGEVVRWIGPPDSEEPAATVTIVAHAGHAHATAQTVAGEFLIAGALFGVVALGTAKVRKPLSLVAAGISTSTWTKAWCRMPYTNIIQVQLQPGRHEVTVEYVDEEHILFEPPVRTSVEVTAG